MAAPNTVGCLEKNSTARPLFLNGSNYCYWKVRMIVYLQSVDHSSWEAVANGPHVHTSTFGCRTFEKPFKDWDETINKKRVNRCYSYESPYYGLSTGEFNIISMCARSKE